MKQQQNLFKNSFGICIVILLLSVCFVFVPTDAVAGDNDQAAPPMFSVFTSAQHFQRSLWEIDELLYYEPFDNLEGWRAEGNLSATSNDGHLQIECGTAHEDRGNVWSLREFETPYYFEFRFRKLTGQSGLNLIFWNARTVDGADFFSLTRTWNMTHVIDGNMESYHISYCRGASNITNFHKNPTFHDMVQEIPDPLAMPGEEWHKVGVYQNGSHIMFFEDGMLVHDIDENADFEDLLCRATLANTRPNYHKSWQVVNEAKNSTCPGLDVKRVFTKDGQAKDYRGDDIEGEPYTFITPSPGYAYSYLSGKIGFRHQNGITLYDDLRVWSLKPPRYGPEKSAIIIDNTDSGASFSTGWNVSTRDPHMGENYRYARVGAKETVTWTPEIEVAGMYTVYVRWPASKPDDRASNAPYTVAYADGKTKTITMNQKQIALANDWQILGTFPFEEGTSGSISLTNETDDSVAADAVKFVYYGRAPGAE